MPLNWSINHTLPVTPNAVVQIKCNLDPNHHWIHCANAQTSLGCQRWRIKVKWSQSPPRTFHRFCLSGPDTGNFSGFVLQPKHFSCIDDFISSYCTFWKARSLLRQNKNVVIFLYSHKNLLRHRLSSFSTDILRVNTHPLSCIFCPHLQLSLSKGQSLCMLWHTA